ncbi:hypothetical protein [Paenibacillus sp. UNC499MF]|uniref:hypothetical protein n=1 Tax=Paenibacillus sp. UNC499MF TaxID=1502751 RepID=UPI00089FD25B|nr:hypothetical protein [Paenibacillus sp. UNC499MF]SEG79598.1 hypothetical protein SAMN02799616_05216 [Paenibacillus sp. UNC499MF]
MTSKNVEKKKEPLGGIAVAISMILVALFLFFNPSYLGIVIVTNTVSTVLMVIGIIGLSIEINKIIGEKPLGFDDAGLGFAFLVFWVIIYHYFDGVIINWILLLFLFFGLYGSVLGIAKIINFVSFEVHNTKQKWLRFAVFIIQVLGFGATILQYLTSFKLM